MAIKASSASAVATALQVLWNDVYSCRFSFENGVKLGAVNC
jgi:hypothetical protein